MTQEQIGQINGEVKARPKLEGGRRFKMISEFSEAGDQPTAIRELAAGIQGQERDQVLLGATGTGKTFTMARLIEETQRPAIILAPNKTLAAQLYGEFKSFFPTIQSNISSAFMIIINPKLMSHARIPILKKKAK